ncbi:MAG: tyrosine-type recombinase/integrase [Elusimicrobiota bacterium]
MNARLDRHLRGFFQVYLRDQRSVSPNTIKSYRDTFKLLVTHLSARKRGRRHFAVRDIDAKAVLAFLQNLEDPVRGRGNCPHSRNLRLAAIQCFFKYLSLHAPSIERQAKRIFAIPAKRVHPKAADSLTRKELEALLAQPCADSADGMRDLAILTFLYNTGARAQEVADVRNSWLDFPNRTVSITGKGQRRRITPLWPATVRLLKLYHGRHRRKPTRIASDRFFINQRGGAFTRFGIRTVVKRYLRLAAKACPSIAKKRLSTHSLRHTCAVHLLESRVDPNVIKSWLGHASINSTSRYLDTDLNHKRRILEQFGPPNYVESSSQPQKPASVKNVLDWLQEL